MRIGYHKRVSFPIQRIEVSHGRSRVRTVEENQAVNCRMCGRRFLINRDTTFILPGPSDVPIVRCAHCNYYAAVMYYYDQIPNR